MSGNCPEDEVAWFLSGFDKEQKRIVDNTPESIGKIIRKYPGFLAFLESGTIVRMPVYFEGWEFITGATENVR